MDENNVIKINKGILKAPNLRVFSKVDNGSLYYILALDSKEESKNNNERIALATFTSGNPKKVKEQAIRILENLSAEGIDKRKVNYLMQKLKEDCNITFTKEYKDLLEYVTNSNLNEEEPFFIQRMIKIEEILQTEKTDEDLDYNKLDKMLPVTKQIFINGVPDELILEIGQETERRIKVLENIKSEEDVVAHKKSIESFMLYKEGQTNKERIISNYVENIQKLDANTIIECLKVMEDESDGKESKLYSIYLRVQEKRIINQVQQYFIDLKYDKKLSDGKIEIFLKVLESQKIPKVTNENLDSIIDYVADNENAEIEEYLKSGRNIDFEMMRYIKKIDDSPATQVIEYLEHRAKNIRQIR